MSVRGSPARRAPGFFQALPAYLGGKRRLCNLIFAELAAELPREQWAATTFLDPFCGGGAVALFAKAQGFEVVASDAAERAAVVARALVANSSLRLRREDVLQLALENERVAPSVAAEAGGGAFTAKQAAWLDRALAVADAAAEPRHSLLKLVIVKLVLRLYPMSLPSASDAEAAAKDDFDRVSSRRLAHYLRARRLLAPAAVWRTAEQVNAGVFGGRGTAERGDAREVIAGNDADVLYLDPPYAGTTRYERAYAVIDRLLGDERPPGAAPSIDELLDVACHIPLVVVSYGGPTTTLDELQDRVARHRRVLSARAVRYDHLRAVATTMKNEANRELLVVAGR